jgi:D-alanine-D-alanine ligase
MQEQPMGKRVAVLVEGIGGAPEVSAVSRALRRAGHQVEVLLAGERLERTLQAHRPDACFLALHGPQGADGQVQALLEGLGLPHTGSGALASGRVMDRPCARRLLAHANLPIARGYAVERGQDALARHGDLGFPCWVKPARAGTQTEKGAAQVEEGGELTAAVERACLPGGRAVVEKRLVGREVSVGLLDGEVLGSLERVPGRRAGRFSRPKLSPTRLGNVEVLARAAFQTLGCRGSAQVTLLCPEEDNEAILEVNPLPALTPRSLLPRVARDAGLSFEALIERILVLATLDDPRPPRTAQPRPQAA